jgi:hypothetical protein
MFRKLAFAPILIAAAVLGYGYWHAKKEGTLYVSLTDVSERDRYQAVMNAELSLLNLSGKILAKTKSEPPYGAIYISEPTE